MIHYQMKILSPLAHGGFEPDDGSNMSLIRREAIVSLPGYPLVPCISANAIRGLVRRKTMRQMFQDMGIAREDFASSPADRALYQCLYAVCCNGGNAAEGPGLSFDRLAQLRKLIPPLSALGSAIYGTMFAGRCRFSFAWLRCKETLEAGLVTPTQGLPSAVNLVAETGMARHIEREHHDPEWSQVKPMPRTTEYIGVGAELEGRIHFEDEATELERSAIAFGLSRLRVIGGNGARGFGEVETTHDGDPGPFAEWLETEAHKAKGFLLDILREVLPNATRKKLKELAEGKKKPKKGKEEAA